MRQPCVAMESNKTQASCHQYDLLCYGLPFAQVHNFYIIYINSRKNGTIFGALSQELSRQYIGTGKKSL